MISKKNRFSRSSFPKKRPDSRSQYSWGAVSVYKSLAGASVVVSKKVLAKAHDRNRLKRRIYSALHEIFKNLNTETGLVVYPKREALTSPLKTLVSDIKKSIS